MAKSFGPIIFAAALAGISITQMQTPMAKQAPATVEQRFAALTVHPAQSVNVHPAASNPHPAVTGDPHPALNPGMNLAFPGTNNPIDNGINQSSNSSGNMTLSFPNAGSVTIVLPAGA